MFVKRMEERAKKADSSGKGLKAFRLRERIKKIRQRRAMFRELSK